MKNIIFALISIFAFSIVNAQSTSPRTGLGSNNDQTGRVLTWKYQSVSDVAGSDSIILATNAYNHTVRLALTDSIFFKNPNVKNCFAADRLFIVASGASGTKVKFASTNFISAGTATLSSSGRAVITFIFDGSKWVESSRIVL